jgi:hypothetical protein
MAGVLYVKVAGVWTPIATAGPPGPTGPVGPQGVQGPAGPAGPQKQAVLTGANPNYAAVPANAWSAYGIATLTLPYTGTWLVRCTASISIGANTSAQVCVGLNNNNMWYASAPWMESAANGSWEMSVEGLYALNAGANSFQIFTFMTGAGGCRYGFVTVEYHGA